MIKNNSCDRRILNELKHYNYNFINGTYIIKYNNKQYTIKVDNFYPFRPPTFMTSNGKPISYNPINYPKRLWEDYRKEKDNCMCCNNSLCENNWSPARTIFSIINEYEAFIERLKIIQKKRMFNFVSLPDDIIHSIFHYL